MTLDPEAMARLLEITGDDAAFVDELIDTFIDDAATQIAGLRVAAAAGDVAGVVRPAHSLKSNSQNVGATLLADLCQTLEADGRAGHVPELRSRIDAVEGEFEAVRARLLSERAAR